MTIEQNIKTVGFRLLDANKDAMSARRYPQGVVYEGSFNTIEDIEFVFEPSQWGYRLPEYLAAFIADSGFPEFAEPLDSGRIAMWVQETVEPNGRLIIKVKSGFPITITIS